MLGCHHRFDSDGFIFPISIVLSVTFFLFFSVFCLFIMCKNAISLELLIYLKILGKTLIIFCVICI